MNTPIKVCHFAASQGLGRGEVYVDLANAMAQSDLPIEVGLLVPKNARFRDRVDARVELMEYKAKDHRRNPRLWLEASKLIKQFDPDIVHSHFAKATSIYRGINFFLKKPFVATKHNPRKGAIYEKIEHVIAVSQAVKNSVRKNQATIIYNGIFPIKEPPENRHHGATLKLLSVGRLDPIKGYDLLLQALAQIQVPWELTILGEGNHRKTLEALSQSLGISDRVHLPGYCEDISEYMAACDAYIVSSHSEGCSVALLEAMHYAPLALSTNVGLAEELFPDWLTWDLYAPETLSKALEDYPALIKKYRNWVEPELPKFHMNNAVAQHIELYKSIIAAAHTKR